MGDSKGMLDILTMQLKQLDKDHWESESVFGTETERTANHSASLSSTSSELSFTKSDR
jgi:hypothetical protein